MIIDVRDNGGGDDRAFDSLIPLIYTNPIYTQNIEFFVTKNNWTEMLDSTQHELNIGKYVNLFGDDKFIEVFGNMKTLDKPKNIAIMIDKYVGSTTEQFLIYAKQSRKVKLFGNNTSGSIDYSNLRFIELIKDSLYVSIPMTRSKRLPENPIAGNGILPDFYLKEKGDKAIYEILNILREWK